MKNKDEKDFLELEDKADRLLDSVAHISIRTSPGFKENILLKASAMAQTKKPSKAWKVMLGPSLAFAIGAVAFSFWHSRGIYEVGTNQQVAIRLDVAKQIASAGQCNVRIELPSGVHFYSAEFPEISKQNSIELPCRSTEPGQTEVASVEALPIVVEGSEEGIKRVQVHYVGSDNREIAQTTFRIRFKKNLAEPA